MRAVSVSVDRGDTGDADGKRSGLASLSITGFRGIDDLRIPRLGRVTLLAGKNGVGKTTVLEALRLYAARGQFDTVQDLLIGHEELTTIRGEDDASSSAADLDRLFHRNGSGDRAIIRIGPIDGEPALKIEPVPAPLAVLRHLPQGVYAGDVDVVLGVVFGDARSHHVWLRSVEKSYRRYRRNSPDGVKPPTPLRCESLGPGPLDGKVVERLWDGVALTDDETLALDALRLVFGDRVERAAATGGGDGRRRRVMVKLADRANPVSLRSLGDGATRMFGVSLALANCRDGILLIDEAENGIHYSLQSKFWNMVLCAAQLSNIQVVATTHSKDCINGFAAAALESPDVSGNLVRIDRHNGELRAVDYSIEELETAAEQNIEVR